MKFAQILNEIMDKRHISAYKISKETGISDRLIGYWKKGDKLPGAENLLTLAKYFSISTDYLLTGEEKSLSEVKLTDDEQELLTYYKDLDEREKALILGEAKGIYMAAKMLVKQPEKAIISESNDTPKLQRAYMVSRSTDNTPPRFVEGDFSDILNAPDVTDEY